MHFTVEHDLPAAPDVVAQMLFDPAFHHQHQLPDLAIPEVVDASSSGSKHALRLRYEYLGHLDPIAKKVIGGRKLTWLQDMTFDTATGSGSITFRPRPIPAACTVTPRSTLTARGDASHLHIEGDLHVRVPLIGGRAENAIVPGVVRRFDVMADALAADLTNPG